MADICEKCASPAKLACQRCRVMYCGKSCQVLDWPTHKYICIPMPPLVDIKNLKSDAAKSLISCCEDAVDFEKDVAPKQDAVVEAAPKMALPPVCADEMVTKVGIMSEVGAVSQEPPSSEGAMENIKKFRSVLQRSSLNGDVDVGGNKSKAPEQLSVAMNLMSITSEAKKPANDAFPVKPASNHDSTLIKTTANNVSKTIGGMLRQMAPKRFFYQQLAIEPIENGPKQKIMCVDRSKIGEQGQFYGFLAKKEVTVAMDSLQASIQAHIKKEEATGLKEHEPKRFEVCLCLFHEDATWYRCICLSDEADDDNMFDMFYLDYGNDCKVKKQEIRPVTKEIAETPVYTQSFTIANFPEIPTKDVVERVNGFFAKHSDLVTFDIKIDDDNYYVHNADLF